MSNQDNWDWLSTIVYDWHLTIQQIFMDVSDTFIRRSSLRRLFVAFKFPEGGILCFDPFKEDPHFEWSADAKCLHVSKTFVEVTLSI